jgi:hypothetical protein
MNLMPEDPMSSRFILGLPFFQNFFAQFTYGNREGTANTVELMQSPVAYPTAEISSTTYTNQTNPFATISDPYVEGVTPDVPVEPDVPVIPDIPVKPVVPDDPVTPVVPDENKLTTLDIVYIVVSAVVLMLIIATITYFCCRPAKAPVDTALGVVYTADTTQLMPSDAD